MLFFTREKTAISWDVPAPSKDAFLLHLAVEGLTNLQNIVI